MNENEFFQDLERIISAFYNSLYLLLNLDSNFGIKNAFILVAGPFLFIGFLRIIYIICSAIHSVANFCWFKLTGEFKLCAPMLKREQLFKEYAKTRFGISENQISFANYNMSKIDDKAFRKMCFLNYGIDVEDAPEEYWERNPIRTLSYYLTKFELHSLRSKKISYERQN